MNLSNTLMSELNKVIDFEVFWTPNKNPNAYLVLKNGITRKQKKKQVPSLLFQLLHFSFINFETILISRVYQIFLLSPLANKPMLSINSCVVLGSK